MKTIAVGLSLTLFLSLAAASQSDERPDAARLLAEHRAGLGDPAALARLGVLTSRGKVSFEGMHGEGSYTELLAPNGAARMEVSFAGAPPALHCSNGQLFWMTGTGGIEVKQGWSAAADARMFALGRHRDWREVYASAECVGPADVEGRACWELSLVPKSPAELGIESVPGEAPPAPDTWWLDRDSKELVRVAVWSTVSGAGWQRLVVDHSDWRAVDGVRFPFRRKMSFGPPDHALVIHTTCESVDLDTELAADPFQPDEEVFRELARLRAGETRKDPGFALQQRKELLTATVRVRCKPAEIQQQLAIVLPEVMAYLQRERLAPVGPPFARYHAYAPEVDLEAGIPVGEKIAGTERVRPSTLPGGDVVSGMHVGAYKDLPRTHEVLAQWLERAGLAPEGGPWEVYWTDPGLERDSAKWRTEIFQPVVRRAVPTAPMAAAAGAAGEAGAGVAVPAGEGSARDAELEPFEILIGTWKVEGDIDGQVSFEWLEGGHFLVQRFELVHAGQEIQGLELIGHERPFGAADAKPGIRSRVYDNMGNTLDYEWELAGGELTIWGGEKGSPFVYRGSFSADGSTLTGGWTWPGGGNKETMTRIVDGRAAKRQEGAD